MHPVSGNPNCAAAPIGKPVCVRKSLQFQSNFAPSDYFLYNIQLITGNSCNPIPSPKSAPGATRTRNLRIRSYSSPCLHSVFAWYYVHIVHKKLQKMSILSIISMLWYPICTRTAPGMKKERRLFYISYKRKNKVDGN